MMSMISKIIKNLQNNLKGNISLNSCTAKKGCSLFLFLCFFKVHLKCSYNDLKTTREVFFSVTSISPW